MPIELRSSHGAATNTNMTTRELVRIAISFERADRELSAKIRVRTYGGKGRIGRVKIVWRHPSRRVDGIARPAMNRYKWIKVDQGSDA